MPEAWFRSEYLCEFSDTIDSVFRYEDIARAFSSDIEPLAFGDAGEIGQAVDAAIDEEIELLFG